jgi:OOP family OmpA-OmpF porin
MPTSRSVIPAVFALVVMASTATISYARDNRDVVQDGRGNVVLNTFGNCVRTDWVGTNNVCRGEHRYAAREHHEVYTSPARSLETEERTVYFEFNKARIQPEEQHKLNSLAHILASDKTVESVSIVGYADRIGSASYNEKLSEKRAKAVESYLHHHGYLNTSMAKVRWLGESEPVTHCPDKLSRKELISCLQKDRRVEVEIHYYPENGDNAADYDTKPHQTMNHHTRQMQQ